MFFYHPKTWHDEQKIPNAKIILFGDEQSGKTTSLRKKMADHSNVPYDFKKKYPPTIGVDFQFFTSPNDRIKFMISDTAGQQSSRELVHSSYKQAVHSHIVIYVDFSKNDWGCVDLWAKEINDCKPTAGILMSLVATKSDLVSDFTKRKERFREKFCKDQRFTDVYISSAKKDDPKWNIKLNEESSQDITFKSLLNVN